MTRVQAAFAAGERLYYQHLLDEDVTEHELERTLSEEGVSAFTLYLRLFAEGRIGPVAAGA